MGIDAMRNESGKCEMDGNCKSTAKLEMEIRKKNAKFATKVKNSKWKLEKRTGNEQQKWKIGNGKWKFEKIGHGNSLAK